MVVAKGNAVNNVYLKSQYRLNNVKLTYIVKNIKTKMRCRRNRSVRALPQRTSDEKSDDPVPRQKTIRKAKFILNLHEGKFGFFSFNLRFAAFVSVGCRSPPITFVFKIKNQKNGGC